MSVLGFFLMFIIPFVFLYSLFKPETFKIRTKKNNTGKWSRVQSIVVFAILWFVSVSMLVGGDTRETAQTDKVVDTSIGKPIDEPTQRESKAAKEAASQKELKAAKEAEKAKEVASQKELKAAEKAEKAKEAASQKELKAAEKAEKAKEAAAQRQPSRKELKAAKEAEKAKEVAKEAATKEAGLVKEDLQRQSTLLGNSSSRPILSNGWSRMDIYTNCQLVLKNQLKSPKSFDSEIKTVKFIRDAEKEVIAVNFDFYATNSFGAELIHSGTCMYDLNGKLLASQGKAK